MEIDIMKATIYYTRTNVSGFSYDGDKNDSVDVRHYDKNGKFIQRTHETPNLDSHYTKVGEVEFPLGSLRTQPENVDELIPSEHLDAVYKYFNTVMPSVITKGIKMGAYQTEHSSMSVGDIIEIDGHFFIVEGMGFGRIEFEDVEHEDEITSETIIQVVKDIRTPFQYFGKGAYASVDYFAMKFGVDVDRFTYMLTHNTDNISQWFRIKKS